MRIIARKALRTFWERSEYADAEQPLRAWFRIVAHADGSTPTQVKVAFGTASVLRNNRLVFNIAGNKYRLIVRVNYPFRVVYIRFIGTHQQYDRIPVNEV